MRKAKIKKVNKEQKDYVETLLEDVNSKFDAVIEGHQVLDAKIDNLEDKMDRRFNNVEIKLDSIETEIHSIKSEIKELKNLLVKKADLGRLEILEKRVIIMEKFLKNKFAMEL